MLCGAWAWPLAACEPHFEELALRRINWHLQTRLRRLAHLNKDHSCPVSLLPASHVQWQPQLAACKHARPMTGKSSQETKLPLAPAS